MKRIILVGAFVLPFVSIAVFGQDIPQNQVPSLVLNSFQQAFPKTTDAEWEMDQGLYKVEFETGLLGTDHDAWYDKTGKLIRHKEEITRTDLPQKVLAKINAGYSGYRIDDVKKITEGSIITYHLELKKQGEEWKMVLDPNGTIISKLAD